MIRKSNVFQYASYHADGPRFAQKPLHLIVPKLQKEHKAFRFSSKRFYGW